tara:strand:+ start:2687 stop:2938 length:252 start_codon:yes stop_codon:yes gene_type:complete
MIEIYGKTACSSCTAAKRFCESRSFEYKYYQLDKDFTREIVLEKFPGARTFPQIKVHGRNVGGFEDFLSYIEDTGYNGSGYGT